ncbi:MAG: GNAT family N-acetyltransferase [Olsenella sp.]|jgi:ribosomal protein S18 acetylase RimI-like enzyme|nr:GNAT family N-acetyltransferase [Olsenella sp.]MCI1288305.1 GNAT family N-acetyltransferase [Olsenella sp.]
MQVRRAEEKDIPKIMDLLVQVCNVHADGRPDLFIHDTTKYTPDELARMVHDDERPIFVADGGPNQGVLGYAFCVRKDWGGNNTPDITMLYIDDICVDEQARGRHVGTAIYNHVIDFARREGFHNVTLNVWSCNPTAQKFYQAMGMVPQKVTMEQVLDQ